MDEFRLSTRSTYSSLTELDDAVWSIKTGSPMLDIEWLKVVFKQRDVESNGIASSSPCTDLTLQEFWRG